MTATTPIAEFPLDLKSVDWCFRLSVAQYEEMIAHGTLTTEDRVELLDGMLVMKMPQNNPHSSTQHRLTIKLVMMFGGRTDWTVRFQLPIKLSTSMPEPDAAIVRGDDRTFDGRNPGPTDFGIVIEIADTSLTLDRETKRRLYAVEGIPEYWIVNVRDRLVTVMTEPRPDGQYGSVVNYKPGDEIPVRLDQTMWGRIAVDDILPR